MSNVYYHGVSSGTSLGDVQRMSRRLVGTLVEQEGVALAKQIPLKVHFGEKGNVTFLKPDTYDGIIDYLEERGVQPCFIETSVLYGGQRNTKEVHGKTAAAHGFTRLPSCSPTARRAKRSKTWRSDCGTSTASR